MWNDIVYGKGGLALHAGLKVIPTADGDKVFMIIGLSGTGKTTTTFTTQNGSRPIQDDFVGLMPGGHAFGTENGCFAKTFGLDPDFEPSIHGAVVKPTAYLENVYQDDDGTVDFFNEHYTKNGRAVFEMRRPALVRRRAQRRPRRLPADPEPEREHHPRGREARTRSRRPPTSCSARRRAPRPAAPRRRASSCACRARTRSSRSRTACRATGLLELLATHPIETYLLNTGRVGGQGRRRPLEEGADPGHVRVREGHRRGTIVFDEDPDFGYQVATSVPEFDDCEQLQPRRLYERAGPRRRVRGDRGAVEERARGPPAAVHAAVGGHHQGGRLTPIVTTRRPGLVPGLRRVRHRSTPRAPRGTTPRAAASRRARRTR